MPPTLQAWVTADHSLRPPDGSTCFSSSNANHTFTSGKLDEIMNLFVGQIERLSPRGYDGRIHAETPLRTFRSGFLDDLFNALQNQLTCRAALARGHLVKSPVQVTGNVDAGAD